MLLLWTALVSASCDDRAGQPETPPNRVSGLITDVVAKSLIEFESITVTADTGEILELNSGDRRFEHFTPSHVREHMLLGLAIAVTYRERDGELVIESLTDAPIAGTPAPP